MKYFSLFTGVGGFEMALKEHECTGINEKGETVEMSDTQRYKMAGNGVVSKVVEHLIKSILIPSDE